MPKEAAPLGRSQARGHQQQIYQQGHQQPSSYHHLQQYHHIPRPPGYEYYSAAASYQNEAPQSAPAPPSALRDVPAAYEHALKMTAKYERLPYAAPSSAGAFKMAAGPYELHPPCTQAPQTSVQHKTSYDRTSHSTMAGYNRGAQPMGSAQYDLKMSAYPPALPYDRFSKKKLATHAPEKSPAVGGAYGAIRNDKKLPPASMYDRPVVPSTSYERLTPKVTVSTPMEVDKGAQNLSYERHKTYRASEYDRRERHRRVVESAERAEAQYERQYEATVSSAYERLGAAPPPIPTIAPSYDRQPPPTSTYERHTNVNAAYERRAVFDRAYEAAAYERRLFQPTSAFSSLNHAYYTANVSGRAGLVEDSGPTTKVVHASSLPSQSYASDEHDPNSPFSSMFSFSSSPEDTSQSVSQCLLSNCPPLPRLIPHDPSTVLHAHSSLANASNQVALNSSADTRIPCQITPALRQSTSNPGLDTCSPCHFNVLSVPTPITCASTPITYLSTPTGGAPRREFIPHPMVRFLSCPSTSPPELSSSSTVGSCILNDPTLPSTFTVHPPSLPPHSYMPENHSNLTSPFSSLVSFGSSPDELEQNIAHAIYLLSDSSHSSQSLMSQVAQLMTYDASPIPYGHSSIANAPTQVLHTPNQVLHASSPDTIAHSPVAGAATPDARLPVSVGPRLGSVECSPNQVFRFLSPASPNCMPYTSTWHYPYPSYGPNGNSLAPTVLYSRGQERPAQADEFEAKDVPTSSVYPAKPRMSLLTSPEYLSSLSRRSQHVEENSRSGQPSVIVPPSRSPADASGSRKRLREGGKSEPLPPISIDTSTCSPKPDPEKPSIYMPTVEPISPTSPPDAAGDDGADAGGGAGPKSSAKDTLLLDISRVDREINKTEHHIFNLKRKQVELEQKAKKSCETEPSDEAVEAAPLPQHFSLSHKIYSENRRRAKEAHGAFSHLGPSVDLPLYNQPSDSPVYQENRRKHLLFKGRLIAHLRRKRREKCSSELKMTEDYAKRTENWNRLLEKMESSPKRKRRDAENRELFEKTFPKIRKEREDRERFLRVGSRVKSDADLEEIMDNLHEQEMEVKKMRDYAAVPPMLLSAECRRCVYVNTNGLIEDFPSHYKDRRLINVWTDAEKDIFREKYLSYPKNFGAIAAYLERKSVSDCVQYYYLSKKTENYKRLLKKTGQKNKSGRSRNKAPPLDPSLLSTPPGSTIAPRFQRDYKPDGSAVSGAGLTPAGAGPASGPAHEAQPHSPTERAPSPSPGVVQPPPAPPPQEPAPQPIAPDSSPPATAPPELPPPPDSTAPQGVATPTPAPRSATVLTATPRSAAVVAPHRSALVAAPPTLMPLVLPFPDIPIVVIDDSDDSNSSSHFPCIRK